MSKDVLLLNADYFPLQAISWERAMVLLFQDKVTTVAMSSREIRSATQTWQVPSVVVLRKYKQGHTRVPMSRDSLYARDSYTCQYCARVLRATDLTLDHVMPKSRGGKSTWENLATSCSPCNLHKGANTPEEAGMRLLRVPFKPTRKDLILYSISRKPIPSEWLDYFK
jgi:5-methylcytosine-specific restriction endonuclease McrA